MCLLFDIFKHPSNLFFHALIVHTQLLINKCFVLEFLRKIMISHIWVLFWFICKYTNWRPFGNTYSFWFKIFQTNTWRSIFISTMKVLQTHTKLFLIPCVFYWNSGMSWYLYMIGVNFSTLFLGLFWRLTFWSETTLLYSLLNNKGLWNVGANKMQYLYTKMICAFFFKFRVSGLAVISFTQWGTFPVQYLFLSVSVGAWLYRV